MYRITFPLPIFRRVLHTLLQRPAAPVRCPVGLSQWTARGELLVAAPESAVERSLLVGWIDTFTLPYPFPPGCAGVLLLGRHQQRGRARGVVQARQVLAGAEAEEAFAAQRDWRHERAGSLASLNQCAVGIAMRLLEDSVAARIQHSTWVRLEFTPTGQMTVTYPPILTVPHRTACSW